jgi:hydrogenase-4 membrane subunit HyfE
MDTLFSLQLLLEVTMFLSVILMNVVKKNMLLINLYIVQSIALTILLGSYAITEGSFGLYLVVIVLFIVKVVIAPSILIRVIRQSKLNISASTYLNVPFTLAILVGISIFAQSQVFAVFASLSKDFSQLGLYLFGGIFSSLFLIVNRKGFVSEIIGLLSFESCIYSFSLFLGLKQLPYLELGMLFDVLFWVIIATVLLKLIYKHYGSFEITQLTALKK